MILETYQEQQAIVQPDPPGQSFATVGTVYEDGIALIFNGAEAESLKHYKCNAAVRFTAGQRVRIIEDSGTYVVEYPVGAPAQSIYADSAARAAYASEAGHAETAGKAVTATKADSATAAGSADTAASAEHAQEAENAQTAKRARTADAHTAGTIGFFGQTPIARIGGVSTVAADASLSTLISNYNKLIRALDYRGYGLID